jgi:chromosome segregation ATPase
MMEAGGRNHSELAKAREMLTAQRAALQHIKAKLTETRQEIQELDACHHALEATGDINRMMAVKTRSMALERSITGMLAAEADCLKRIESIERYVETLTSRLEGLRREYARLIENLAVDDLSGDVKAKLQSLGNRVRMRIEALGGKA